MTIINNKNYVDKAEKVIRGLISDAEQEATRNKDYIILTTTQLRKQLSMTSELFLQAEREPSETLNEELRSKIEYLRVQFVYQAGRETSVKNFIDKAKVIEILKEINGNKNYFLTFCRYMEALVAYRKYLGNADK